MPSIGRMSGCNSWCFMELAYLFTILGVREGIIKQGLGHIFWKWEMQLAIPFAKGRRSE